MKKYVEYNLNSINGKIISDIYDVNYLIKSFKESKIIPKESFYLKYTIPIFINHILDIRK